MLSNKAIGIDRLTDYDKNLKEVASIWQKNKSYSVDEILQYKGKYLKCTTAGTSGTATLDFTGVEVGDTITDGTVVWEVFSPFAGSESINHNSYSTAEQEIGVWIDGKKLYRKVYNNPTFPLDTGLGETSYTVVQLYGHVKDGTNNYNIPYADGDYFVGLYINNSSGMVTLAGASSATYIVAEYTKV